jgi:hypothetical protein
LGFYQSANLPPLHLPISAKLTLNSAIWNGIDVYRNIRRSFSDTESGI